MQREEKTALEKRASMRLPQHFLNLAQGRYPGSQVLICRLPMIAHSGQLANPHLLTVAGAAQALELMPPYLFPV